MSPARTSLTSARARARARALAATVAGLVVVAGVALGATRGAGLVPAPDPVPSGSTALASRAADVAVQPGDTVLACPGPARLTDTRTGGDPQFAASPSETSSTLRVLAAAPGGATVRGLGDTDPLVTLPGGTPPAVGAVPDLTSATTVRADAGDGAVGEVAATVASSTTSGDLRGLAAAVCAAPATDLWLVGGSTTVGSSTQLVLQNPGRDAATVSVDVYGENGPVTLADSASVVVPAGKEVVRLVEAAAADQDRVVVHVAATGSAVSAHLQHTVLDGVVPQGVDLVAPGAAPAHHAVVAGVLSRGEEIGSARAPQLRLLAPRHAATADISVWGPRGRVWVHGLESVDLDRGDVVDVPLGGLPAGTYTVVVDASADVVAGAVSQRPASADATDETAWDVAWSPTQAWGAAASGPPAASTAPVAVPQGLDAAVAVTAVPADRSSDAAADDATLRATVTVLTAAGRTVSHDYTVRSGATVVVDPATLTSDDVAAVSVDAPPTSGVGATWGVVLSDGPAASGATGPADGTLFSVVAPTGPGAAATTVRVQQDPTTGLG